MATFPENLATIKTAILGEDMRDAIHDAVEQAYDLADSKVDAVSGKGLSTEDYTSAEKVKLAGIEAGAQVNTVTGVKGNSEEAYRDGNVNITKANIGLGNVDNTSDTDKPVSTLQQTALNGKVDKVTGKGLSTEDYTTIEKITSKLLPEELMNCVKIPTYINDKLAGFTHRDLDGSLVRTDVFAVNESKITETRTLTSGESVTIITDLSTMNTTVEYEEA